MYSSDVAVFYEKTIASDTRYFGFGEDDFTSSNLALLRVGFDIVAKFSSLMTTVAIAEVIVWFNQSIVEVLLSYLQ